LCVGTIEPRKNHAYVLDAFESIWKQGLPAKLCIVGRIGWKCEEFVARVLNHSLLGDSLFMFNDLTDAELHYCYQHAKMLILPSVIEGFGLPIVEALHFGLPTLASDIPIHHEVGGAYCGYFDLHRAMSLAEIVLNIEQRGQHPPTKPAAEYPFTSWKHSCRELLTKCLELGRQGAREARGPISEAV
jgi:alpha-1,2-rhamnosyltransferase